MSNSSFTVKTSRYLNRVSRSINLNSNVSITGVSDNGCSVAINVMVCGQFLVVGGVKGAIHWINTLCAKNNVEAPAEIQIRRAVAAVR